MDSGPNLLFELAPGAATAAIGAWMRRGSAHEPEHLAGVTHLLEHLLLRRCGARTPEGIAELVDSLGGDVDAFTTRETCAITAHVPARRFAEAVDLVFDAVLEPRFREEEVSLERKVVDAEFDLVQDSPGEVAAEQALLAAWGDHPLARPVLGDRATVRRLKGRDLKGYHQSSFGAEQLLVVAVAPDGERQIDRRLGRLRSHGGGGGLLEPPTWRSSFHVESRDGLEQVYASLLLPGLAAADEEGMTLAVIEQLLGGGTSSRLFREVRDRRGLAYDVGSSVYATSVAGVLEVTFSAPARAAASCWSAILEVLDDLGRGAVSDREVTLAREALSSGIVLGSEGPDVRMDAHAGEWLSRRRRFDPAALQGEVDAVTPERVKALARRLVRLDALAGAVCGPVEGLALPPWIQRRVA